MTYAIEIDDNGVAMKPGGGVLVAHDNATVADNNAIAYLGMMLIVNLTLSALSFC